MLLARPDIVTEPILSFSNGEKKTLNFMVHFMEGV